MTRCTRCGVEVDPFVAVTTDRGPYCPECHDLQLDVDRVNAQAFTETRAALGSPRETTRHPAPLEPPSVLPLRELAQSVLVIDQVLESLGRPAARGDLRLLVEMILRAD